VRGRHGGQLRRRAPTTAAASEKAFVDFYEDAGSPRPPWKHARVRLPGMTTTRRELQFLTVERPEDGIAVVTLDRPDRLNALSWPMVDEFLGTMGALGEDDALRVIVLTGAGRGFCAGLDIKQRDDALGGADDVSTVYRRQEKIGRLATDLRANPHPIVAAVNGPAAGGGLAIALAADVRIAAPEASFHASFIRIGLSCCDAGVSYLLPRLIGLGLAS
jgi:enoyl-CoA hydratase/carnithine racemase